MPQNVGFVNKPKLPVKPGDTTPNPGVANIGSKIFSTVVQEDLIFLNGKWTREDSKSSSFSINADTTTLFKCAVVYLDLANSVYRAVASDAERRKVAGLIASDSVVVGAECEVISSGVFTATASEWSTATGSGGGLVPGATYYLSTTQGRLTLVPPVLSGLWVVEVGKALNTTDLLIDPGVAILN